MNRSLDTYSLRERTTARNIANVNTPNFRPERVKFEEFFQNPEVVAQGTKTDTVHIPIGKPDENNIEGEREDRAIPKPDVYFSGETHVNIDKEMAEMAQNQIRFRFSSGMVKRYFQGLSSAIRGINQ